jgi:hypothetical protein
MATADGSASLLDRDLLELLYANEFELRQSVQSVAAYIADAVHE